MEVALEGVRVLDLSQYIAGPYGTQILADLGAEVIKVEPPDLNPEVRRMVPLDHYDSHAAGLLTVNRNKKSVALDLKQEAGREAFHALTRLSDVVYDNFRPGVMERLGLGYEALAEINPRIIACSVTGFGATGPWSGRPAFDMVAQGMSGMISLTGEPDGAPVPVGFALTDLMAGINAAHGILAALYARERTGRGQKVEVSLLASSVGLLSYDVAGYLVRGIQQERRGRFNHTVSPYGVFTTSDGYIALSAHRSYERFCRAIGREDLLADPRFTTLADRVAHRKEMGAILEAHFQTQTTEHWLTVLEQADVPCGPVNSLDQVFSHPQVQAQDMVVEFDYVLGGRVRAVGNPIKLSGTPPEERRRAFSAPLLGQHTAEVLGALLGYSRERLEDLARRGVIGDGSRGE